MQDKDIDKILKPIQGGNMEVYSFTSSKNTNVSSVQFVIKTSEIKKEEVKKIRKLKKNKLSFKSLLVYLQIYSINNVNNNYNIG